MRRGSWLFLGVLALLLMGFATKHLLLALPAVDQSPAAGSFDTNRAFGRLQRILGDQRSHPVDSAAGDGVRDRLVGELRAAGLQPRMTDELSCNRFERSRNIACSRIRNVVVTIGPAAGKHLLLVSHYDSSAAGPGAADDGIGVAAMIEVASLLRNAPLQRPVTFLFNEGEETGLSGARSFLDSDPVAPLVDTMINLEARGTEGQAIMFETSRPNAAAIRAFAAGTRAPFANSLSTDFYRLIPNSTDVTVFQERPWTILNFAIIGNETRYHSLGDELSALDLRSLQHMGREALGITGAIAVDGEAIEGDGEIIYADFYGLFLITLPLILGLVLLGALAIFFLAAGWRTKALGRALLTAVGGFLGAFLLGFAFNFVASWFRPADYWRGYPLVTFTAFYALALGAAATALLIIGARVERERLRIAFWLFFLLLGGLICFVAPGAAIYFLFPPLAVAIGLLLRRFFPPAERIAAIAGALLLFLTLGQMLTAIELLLIDGPYWVLAPLGVLAAFPLLIEAKPSGEPGRGTPVLVPLGLVGLALWAGVLLAPRSTEDRQAVFTVEYFKDLAGRRALWGISNKAVPLPSGWAGSDGWEIEELPYSSRRRWTAQAPDLPVPAPAFEVVGQQAAPGGGRRVLMVLRPNGADAIGVRFPAEAQLRRAGLAGKTLEPGGNASDAGWVRCTGRACDGMTVELLLGRTEPVEVEVLGTWFRLPDAAAPLVAARPALSRPQYTPDSTYVIGRARL